jgi:hypothetical protein
LKQGAKKRSQHYGAPSSAYIGVGKTTWKGSEIPFAISPVVVAVAKATADEQEFLELAKLRDKIDHFALGGTLFAFVLGVTGMVMLSQ